MSATLILDSLRRRMRAMHSLYEDATATMTLEQVNHVERDAVLPIAFSLFHFVNMEDTTYPFVAGGEGPVWNDDWADRLAGGTSTACATWARSNTPAPSSASPA